MKWLHCKWVWANENRLFWANIGLLAGTYLFTFVCQGPSALPLRLWSLFLQLLGVVTVWYDLTRTARHFGKGQFIRNTLQWLKSAFREPAAQNHTVSEAVSIGDSASLKLRKIPKSDSLAERVQTLEVNFARMDEDFEKHTRNVNESLAELSYKLTAEAAKREDSLRTVNANLEDAVIGNLAPVAFGVVWLAAGIVLAAFVPEIVGIVGGH